ncbi:MAG: lipase secretion chaperone [Acidobacteriota bacterium]
MTTTRCLLLLLILLASPTWAVDGTSLADTRPDGRFAADADGQLMIDDELRRVIDYFLSARGEIADAELVRHVAEEASHQLAGAPDAATSAVELFDRYLRYVDTAETRIGRAIEKAANEPSRVAAIHRQVTALRTEAFGETTARALFGDVLRQERAALALQAARLEARSPGDLKAARVAYEASLTADERAARTAARRPLEVAAEVAALREGGATAEEIWAVRAEAFGAEAADRLAALDRRRRLD